MSTREFNHMAPSFLSKASDPGFWSYAALIADGVHRRYRIYRDRRALERMPDSMLHDVGVNRSEIDRFVTHGRDFPRSRAA